MAHEFENNFYKKKKVWFLDDEDGKPHVLVLNKPVIYERARFLLKRLMNPDAPLREMFT